jgi:hypothetical protein
MINDHIVQRRSGQDRRKKTDRRNGFDRREGVYLNGFDEIGQDIDVLHSTSHSLLNYN